MSWHSSLLSVRMGTQARSGPAWAGLYSRPLAYSQLATNDHPFSAFRAICKLSAKAIGAYAANENWGALVHRGVNQFSLRPVVAARKKTRRLRSRRVQ